MPEADCLRPSTAAIRQALDDIVDPCSIATGAPIGLVAMGLVSDIRLGAAGCTVVLRVTSPLCMQMPMIMDAVDRRLRTLDNIGAVECIVDPALDWEPAMMAPAAMARLRALRPLPGGR